MRTRRCRVGQVAALAVIVIAGLAGCGGGGGAKPQAASQNGETAGAGLDNPAVRRLQADPEGAEAGTLGTLSPTGIADTAFLRVALDSAQALWRQKFASAGIRYEPAKLVFFHTAVHTACGEQSAATGPFYCPADHGVYLNTDFFEKLGRTFGLRSPFAPGYITAHEVAHHVQQLLGLHARVAAENARDPAGTNARSVRVELQADCDAGVWLHSVARGRPVARRRRGHPAGRGRRRRRLPAQSGRRRARARDLDARLLRAASPLGQHGEGAGPAGRLRHVPRRLTLIRGAPRRAWRRAGGAGLPQP